MSTSSPLTAALIVAAGRGTRAASGGGSGPPKQYARLAGRAVLEHTIAAFAQNPRIGAIQVVIHDDDRALYTAATGNRFPKLLPPVAGGATRAASVRAGLAALDTASRGGPTEISHVLIHDAARPLVAQATIDRVISALTRSPAVIAAVPVADTLKRADDEMRISGTVDRAGLWRAQTPQAFGLATAIAMHDAALRAGRDDFTDDAAVAEWQGIPVLVVAGSEGNRKITTEEDLHMLEASATQPGEWYRGPPLEIRTGQGFDVHRFTAGDHVWLCGLRVPHTAALEGHSDADVALHALTDALLGAIGEGDIGQHFPPSDPQWRGAASRLFLADAARRVAEKGGRIVNVDVTILCEAPRIGPHRETMRAIIADILGIAADRANVKATTTERLGFTGRREGIAAMAIAAVAMPAR